MRDFVLSDLVGAERLHILQRDHRAFAAVESFRAHIADAGRQPTDVGLQVWARLAGVAGENLVAHSAGWRELGATHYAVETSGVGLTSAQAHIDQLRKVREILADEFAAVA